MTSAGGMRFARFGIERDKITKNRVHHKLFEPRKDGRLSVQSIDSLDRPQIEEIGERVARESNKTLYGWAVITRSLVDEIKLTVCIDNNPHIGHATLTGWPEERNLRLDIQKILAANCCRILLEKSKPSHE